MQEITVILPAYEEADNLTILLPKIQQALHKASLEYCIIVVDTMESTDNTPTICKEYGACYVNRLGGNNYGDAIRTGIQSVKTPWTVIMDADGSHDPEDIPRLYEEAQNGNSIVIGSRYTEGGSSHNGNILRFMSFMVNLVYRFVFRINAKDVSDSYRIYDTQKLQSLQLSSDNFDIVEEILILFSVKYKDFRLKEIPIYFNKRIHGESKRNLVKFIFSYIGSIIRMYRIKRQATRVEK